MDEFTTDPVPDAEIRQRRARLIEALLHLRQELKLPGELGLVRCRRDSICENLQDYLRERYGVRLAGWFAHRRELSLLWEVWPRFSGSPAYPVPHPTMPPYPAFQSADWKNGAYWDERTEYGRARHELLSWLIERLQETVSDAHTTGEAA